MSTVMRPKGPLPPQVYWTRRFVLVVLLVVVVALLWWALPGFGGGGNAAADPGTPNQPSGQSSDPGGSGSTPGPGESTQQGVATHHHATTPAQQHPTAGQQHTTPPTHPSPHPSRTTPTGRCDPSTLTMTVAVDSAPVGRGTAVGLRLSTPDGSTCSLGITPSLLEARIVSVPATIWQSRSCPDALPAKNVVVGPRPRIVYVFDWDGQVNPDSCSASDRIAQPGGYWAEVALVGGEPHKAYFEVTSASTPAHTS